MRILFITSTRLGDAVLSLGLLHHLIETHPQANITIVSGPLPASLFTAIPQVTEIIPLVKEPYDRHWLKLWWRCLPHVWDIIVDLRGSAISYALMHKKRYGLRRNDALHRVAQNAATLKLSHVPDPQLWLTDSAKTFAAHLIPDGAPVLGIGPTANWAGKTWAAENFIQLIYKLLDGPCRGMRVAIFGAPNEKDQAYPVFEALSADIRIDLVGKGNPLESAACLARCALYIGNDSGLMHMAAALGVPTVGLFGPSKIHHYRPWGDHTTFAQTTLRYDELVGGPGYNHLTTGTLMGSLSVDAAYDATLALLKKQGKQ